LIENLRLLSASADEKEASATAKNAKAMLDVLEAQQKKLEVTHTAGQMGMELGAAAAHMQGGGNGDLADWFRETFCRIPDHPSLVELSKPRLATVREAPSREEWAAWRDDPTTLFVMAALKRNAEECQEQWMRASWEGGKADQRMLDATRAL
jgi:hypothetical protein